MAADKDTPPIDEDKWKEQDAADEREIARLLEQSQDASSGGGGLRIDDTPFDQTNKADDAEDYEDISDDDLPDEEPNAGASLEIPALTDDGGTSNDAEDLFGEGPSSPTDPIVDHSSPGPRVRDTDAGDETQQTETGLSFSGMNFDPDPHLHGALNQDPDIPAPAETVEDLLKATWPAYKKGHILTWSELLPPKKATWKEKKPAKKPRQLVTSKLNLDLAGDEEKQFRIPGPSTTSLKNRASLLDSKRLVLCDREISNAQEDVAQFDIDQDSDSESVMGYTMRDIELACEDWGNRIQFIESDFQSQLAAEAKQQSVKRNAHEMELDDEWDAEFLQDVADDTRQRPKKRRALVAGLPEIPRYTAPSFDNFEQATKQGAKRVHLDFTDPHLLLETENSQGSKRSQQDDKAKRGGSGAAGRDMANRFNLSNDEAYDLLKENHQSKVRATLGNISVEHSMPAIKLTWPYYKVRLPGTTDEYHRPRFRYKKFAGHVIKFDKPHHHKRKMMKGKAHEIYHKSKDLSMSDNSTAVLFEYCEPRPRVLNNFGMGSKLINYYRRKDTNDEDQLPKQDLGEYRTLLPEDRSPFALFGTVDSGETVPTLHNEMYRAPVFKHNPRNSDFLIVRSTTGVEGSRWYMHKIDHIHVVGQTFPSVEVPGPHSRKVTNASKNRMKMLAFRMIRHSQTDNCQLGEITKHIADSTDTQNRQKLKEFLQYDRDSGEKGMWRLKPNEVLPDENAIRAMIKPEDVSLLDAMQLGIKELEDAGYDPRNANIEDDAQGQDDGDEDDGDDDASKVAKAKKQQEKQEETLADKMAPWKTTKAFIDASAQKAMLQLHGEGDPTGHGLGFSFIRTSMKGGYIEAVQGPLATSADAIEREKRANGGHAYNVKKQQAMYEEGIREIWDKQKATLSDQTEHDDKDIQPQEDEDDRFNVQSAATPAHFDDGTSQISGLTSSSRHIKRAIRINRQHTLPDGSVQTRSEVVHDPVVISQYMKRRAEADMEMKDIYSARPTGNADHDRLAGLRIKKELERLEKNKARRQAREQQKELHQKAAAGESGSPQTPSEKIPTGTTRKCANCGQVGHIKTNKNTESLIPPPPRLSFDWWSIMEGGITVSTAAAAAAQQCSDLRSNLLRELKRSDRQAKIDAKVNERRKREEDRAREREAAKLEKERLKEVAREQRRADKEQRDERKKRETEERRVAKEKEKRERDAARRHEVKERKRQRRRLKRERERQAARDRERENARLRAERRARRVPVFVYWPSDQPFTT